VISAWRRRRIDFGCDFCADDQNQFFGHVTQIATDEARRLILLHCSRCGAYYESTPRGADKTRRLSSAEAHERYGID